MNILFDPHEKEPPKLGLIVLQVLILILFCVFALRFWFLQVHRGQEYARLSRENQFRQESVLAPRGLICTRDGQLIASNDPAYALGLIREDCPDEEATLRAVSSWLNIPSQQLITKYKKMRNKVKPFRPCILMPNLNFSQVAKIETHALRWPGLEVLVRSRRHYAYGPLFSHVLGYVAEANDTELEANPELVLGDHIGKLGLEKFFEDRLRGTKGSLEVEVDATGRHMEEQTVNSPQAGTRLTLALDFHLQALVNELMQDKEGVVVVMDADSGQIYALVSAPTYDTNKFAGGISSKEWKSLSDNPKHPLLNRATQSMYPPGSVFKLLVAGSGLAEHMLNPKETVDCTGSLPLGDRVFHCWKREGHGSMNLQEALAQSCDVFFYRLGMRLGVDRISSFCSKAGFGKPSGIDLPHEKSGLIPTKEWKLKRFSEPWQKGEDLNLAIGQGYTLVTPLQVARYIAALINGGRLLKPQLLKDARPKSQGSLALDLGRYVCFEGSYDSCSKFSFWNMLVRKNSRSCGWC